jgi:hypothetical protein
MTLRSSCVKRGLHVWPLVVNVWLIHGVLKEVNDKLEGTTLRCNEQVLSLSLPNLVNEVNLILIILAVLRARLTLIA